MAMNSAQLTRFMGRVDATLEGLFPAVIRINGQSYQCTGVGGDAMNDYLEEGGKAPSGTRFFRIQKAFLPLRPESGLRIAWITAPGSEEKLTVMDCPDRPHETAWVLRCEPTNR